MSTVVSIKIRVLAGIRDALRERGKPMTAVELAEVLDADEGTFYRNLHALEKAGFLECVGLTRANRKGGPRARLWRWVT